MGDAAHPHLISLDTEFRHVCVVGKDLRKNFQSDHSRRQLILTLRQGSFGDGFWVAWIIARSHCRGAPLCDAARQIVLACLKVVSDYRAGDAGY